MCLSLRATFASLFSILWSTAYAFWFVRLREGESTLGDGKRTVFLSTREAQYMLLAPAFMTMPAIVQLCDAIAHLDYRGIRLLPPPVLGTLGYLSIALQPCAICLAAGLHFDYRTEWPSVMLYVVAAIVLSNAVLNLLYAEQKHKWLTISVKPLRAWGMDVHAVRYRMWGDDGIRGSEEFWIFNGAVRAVLYFVPLAIGTACLAYQALVLGLRERTDCSSHPHWCTVSAWSLVITLLLAWALLVVVLVATAIADAHDAWVPSLWCTSAVIANWVGTALLLSSQPGELLLIHGLVGIGGFVLLHVGLGLLEEASPPPDVRPRLRR